MRILRCRGPLEGDRFPTMRTRTEPRRAKLPPILDADEDGLPVFELEFAQRPRWSSDAESPGVQLGDWPTDLED